MTDGDTVFADDREGFDVAGTTAESGRVQEDAGRSGLVSRFFSPRSFAVAALGTVVGWFVIGGILPLGLLGNLAGVLAAAFAHGVLAGERRYVEAGTAGLAVGGIAAVIGSPVLTLLGLGIPIVAAGAIGGAIAGLVGHYLGRDLRAGVTREI